MPDSNKCIMLEGVARVMPNGLQPNLTSKKALSHIALSPFHGLSSDGEIQGAHLDVSLVGLTATPPFHSMLSGMPF